MKIDILDINEESIEGPSLQYKELVAFQKKICHNLKSAQFHLSKHLSIKCKKLENKAKKREEGSKEQLKIEHKQKEIDFLKNADLDNLSKRIFATAYTEDDLDKMGDKMSLEDRIVVRCFNFPLIKNDILKFRSEHPDWEKLAEDLLYKNTSGRMKISKSKKVVKIPLSIGETAPTTNVKKELKESILVMPALEAEKEKNELEKKYKIRTLKKVIQSEMKEAEIDKLKEKNATTKISEETINEFIKNVDDLDEWEKDNINDEDDEIDLITSTYGSVPPRRRMKRSEKKMNHNSNRITGQKWKKPSNQFGTKKTKLSE